MADRNYFVFDSDNCKFEGMTKEQIIAAIVEATGVSPSSIDDAFITKIKELNKNQNLKFWIGTTAEYNALEEYEPNCFYIFSDSDELSEIEQFAKEAAEEKANEVCAELQSDITTIQNTLALKGAVLCEDISQIIGKVVNNIDKYKFVSVETGAGVPAFCVVKEVLVPIGEGEYESRYKIEGMSGFCNNEILTVNVYVNLYVNIETFEVVEDKSFKQNIDHTTVQAAVATNATKITGLF